jgi:hypothetical protein
MGNGRSQPSSSRSRDNAAERDVLAVARAERAPMRWFAREVVRAAPVKSPIARRF